MDKKLQDLAWSILPKEFKEEVKYYYQRTDCGTYAEDMLESIFGIHNLTSDAEGEEMLYVSRKKVQDYYTDVETDIIDYQGKGGFGLGIADPTLCERAKGMKAMLHRLFGSKCLTDEEQPKPKFHKGDKVKVIIDGYCKDAVLIVTDVNEVYPQFSYKLNCHPDAWFAESTLGPYEEPKPAEPKFKVGDKAILKEYVCTITSIVHEQGKFVGYKIESPLLHGNATVPESDLEPYTEPTENPNPSNSTGLKTQDANKQFDTIIKDGFSKERRLNIAKDFASVLLSRLNYDPFTAQINCCCSNGAAVNPYINIARIALSVADALIAESEKGGPDE